MRSTVNIKEYLPFWWLFFRKLGKFDKKKYFFYLGLKKKSLNYFNFFFLSNFFVNFYLINPLNYFKFKVNNFINIFSILTNLYVPLQFFVEVVKIFPNVLSEKLVQSKVNFFNSTTNKLVGAFAKFFSLKTLFYLNNKALIGLLTNTNWAELKDRFFFWFKFLMTQSNSFFFIKNNVSTSNFFRNYLNIFTKIKLLLKPKHKIPVFNKNLFFIKYFQHKKTKVHIFWWLIKLFTYGKTSQVKNERLLVIDKPKKIWKSFHNIINRKLTITYQINRKTISFFYKKKTKFLIKRFLSHILWKKKFLCYPNHLRNDLCYFNMFKFILFWIQKNKKLSLFIPILKKRNFFFLLLKIYFLFNFVVKKGKNFNILQLLGQQQFFTSKFKTHLTLFYSQFSEKKFKKSHLVDQLLIVLPKLITCFSFYSVSKNHPVVNSYNLILFWSKILLKIFITTGIPNNLVQNKLTKLLLFQFITVFWSFFKKKKSEINLLFKNSIIKMDLKVLIFKNSQIYNIFSDFYNLVNYTAHYCDFTYAGAVVFSKWIHLMNKNYSKIISDTWVLPVWLKNKWILTFNVENFFFKIFQNFMFDTKFLIIIFFYINIKFH
jgi:hypothetical protein